jgi:hypothetical protein
MGAKDVRKDATGTTDFRIQRQLKSFAKVDSPPTRVKPVPITVLLHVLAHAYGAQSNDIRQSVADMIVIGFYFLLRPGEYTGTSSDGAPFRIRDISLFVNDTRIDILTATASKIESASAVSYTFTTQKNANKNEVLMHGRSTDRLCCPVTATIRRILYHRRHSTPHSAPIASYYTPTGRRSPLRSNDVTDTLRNATAATQHLTGLSPKDITAKSLRAGGAMALLCGKVDHNLIQILGRWHSDSMVRYLHLQAKPVMQGFASKMFNHGSYSFLPEETVPVAE